MAPRPQRDRRALIRAATRNAAAVHLHDPGRDRSPLGAPRLPASRQDKGHPRRRGRPRRSAGRQGKAPRTHPCDREEGDPVQQPGACRMADCRLRHFLDRPGHRRRRRLPRRRRYTTYRGRSQDDNLDKAIERASKSAQASVQAYADLAKEAAAKLSRDAPADTESWLQLTAKAYAQAAGDTATAWTTYNEVLSNLANQAGPEKPPGPDAGKKDG